jgi:hypothetical protein
MRQRDRMSKTGRIELVFALLWTITPGAAPRSMHSRRRPASL